MGHDPFAPAPILQTSAFYRYLPQMIDEMSVPSTDTDPKFRAKYIKLTISGIPVILTAYI